MRVLISIPVDSVIHFDIFESGQSRLVKYPGQEYRVEYVSLKKPITVGKIKRTYWGKHGFERAWRWCYRNLINK